VDVMQSAYGEISLSNPNDSTKKILITNKYGSTYLSQREAECMRYIIQGKTARETADLLMLSHRTVESHIARVKEKFDCNRKSELIEMLLNSNFSDYFG